MPLNLYETLRIFSSLVYWHIPEWGQTEPYQPPELPYGIEPSQAYQYPDQIPPYMFQRIRYSSNFLVNTFSSVLQLAVIWVLYWMARVLYRRAKKRKSRGVLVNSLQRFLFKLGYNYVLKTHEAIFLNIFLSINLQIINPNFRTAFNGMGFVCAVGCLAYFIAFFYKIKQKVNKYVSQHKLPFFVGKYSPLIEDIKFENDPNNEADANRWPFKQYPQLIGTKRMVQKNYHFIGFGKKMLVSVIVVLLHGYSYTQEWLMILLHLGMLALTVFSRPYTWTILNVIKIFGDLLLLVFFFLLFVADKFYNDNFVNTENGVLEETTITTFNDIGWTLILMTFVFNGIYVLKFIVNLV